MLTITFQQKSELVDKLLACPHMRSFSKREAVVGLLPNDIAHTVSLGSIHNARLEVLAIVDACLDIENGLIELLKIMQWLDGNSIKFNSLCMFLENNLELGYINKQRRPVSSDDSEYGQDSAISEKISSSMKSSNEPSQTDDSTTSLASLRLPVIIEVGGRTFRILSEKVPHKVYFFIGLIIWVLIVTYTSYQIPSLFKGVNVIFLGGTEPNVQRTPPAAPSGLGIQATKNIENTIITALTNTPTTGNTPIATPTVLLTITEIAIATITTGNIPVTTPTIPPLTEGMEELEYTVVSGDNFIIIAKKCGVTLDDLKKANPSYAPFSYLHIGNKLKVLKPTKPENCK